MTKISGKPLRVLIFFIKETAKFAWCTITVYRLVRFLLNNCT